MRHFLLIIASVCWFSLGSLYAQDRTVSGTVTDSKTGEGLPGVNVLVVGTSNGATTDFDGKYKLSVSGDVSLKFSYIGYKPQTIEIGSRSVINVKLQEDVEQLSEVVVVGYGQVEAKDATGAVERISSKEFNGGVIASPEQLIQGKSAGVQITSASGEPGAGVNIRIRGTSSVRNGNNPLFVVDGIPLSGGDVTSGGADLGSGTSSSRNPLNFLNPNDIESIDILKDASATAIYGSRGANGVVLITTKGGEKGQKIIEYNASVSFARPSNRYDLLTADEYLEALPKYGVDPNELDNGSSTDWQDEISRTAISTKHDVAYSSGHETGNYRVSAGYENQQGVIKNSAMERLNARLNLNQKFLNDKLTFSTQITLSRVNDIAPPITDNVGFEGDLLGAAYLGNPTLEADPTVQPAGFRNPLAMLEYNLDEAQTDRVLINASLDYDITQDLNFRINGGFDDANSTRNQMVSPELNIGNTAGNGQGSISNLETGTQIFEAILNYDKKIGEGNLSALAGYSYQRFERSGNTLLGFGFQGVTDMNQMISNLNSSGDAIRSQISGSYQQFGLDSDGLFVNRLFPEIETDEFTTDLPNTSVDAVGENIFAEVDELQSYFGRLNYNLLDKYLFTATVRADGSSRFGSENKYGVFPSGAFAWRLSDEAFIPDLFFDLKFRVGFGITGNQEIPHNLHQQRQRYGDLTVANTNINPPGTSFVAYPNPDLKWEETSQTNIGLDFAFLKGRLNGNVDYYYKNTTDLLIQVNSAQPAATPFTWQNLDANVINQGVEFALDYVLVDNTDFSWNAGFNVSYNKNIIQNYDGQLNTGAINGQGLTGAFAQQIVNGQPLFAYYMSVFEGYDENGLNVEENNGIPQLVGKSPIPIWNFGINSSARYKNFDFSLYMNGQGGHYLYNNTENGFFTAGAIGNGRNVTKEVVESEESSSNTATVSTRFLQKGDFLRLQNLSVGYNFSLDGNSFVKAMRLSANAQNLFVLTEYNGIDPEINTNKSLNGVPSLGIEYTAFPRARTLTLGLNVTF